MFYIDDIHGYSCMRPSSTYTHLFIFRFLAHKLTDGESPDEVHIFSVESEEEVQYAADALHSAVAAAK